MPSVCLSVALCHLSACISWDGGLYPIIAWRLAAGLPCSLLGSEKWMGLCLG
jgi:hypothetical protein